MQRELAVLVVAVCLAGGCATRPPTEEVRAVSKSFSQLNAATQPLLDDFALAERAQGKTAAEKRAEARRDKKPVPGVAEGKDPCPEARMTAPIEKAMPAVQEAFCLDDSSYYSEITDPPGTLAFRRALSAVGNYTELLVVLAEGRNVPEAQAQLQALAGDVNSVLAIAGQPAAGAAVTTAVAALKPLTDLAARDANAQELERVVRQEAPKVKVVIQQLRSSAPELFKTVTAGSLGRYNAEGLRNAAVAAEEAKRIEGYRVAVANYVVLLGQYEELLGRLVAAYDHPGQVATLAGLSQRSAELAAQADAWRRTLAELRTGLR